MVPTVYNASGDPAACAILREIARRPYVELNWLVLRDRLEEMGGLIGKFGWWEVEFKNWQTFMSAGVQTRSAIRRQLKRLRTWLVGCFGEFEPVEIPF